MPPSSDPDERQLLTRAREGHTDAFDALALRYRRELRAHCYRMLGSPDDADDALQESMLAAWRGLGGFEGRSSLRTWLYRITTNACLRFAAQRPRRMLSTEYGPPRRDTVDLGAPVTEPIWIEPCPDEAFELPGDPVDDDPAAYFQRRETVALAFVAALQHLPGTQRAALILCDVLEFSATEVADTLDTTVASVNSALQRSRKTMKERAPARSQHHELQLLGQDGVRELLGKFVAAWEGQDIPALVSLLSADVRFTMPPLPAWFDGRDAVIHFFAQRVFQTPWRLVPMRANGQPGFACYMRAPGDDRFRLGAINLVSVRDGRIAAISAFLDPAVHRRFGLPTDISSRDR